MNTWRNEVNAFCQRLSTSTSMIRIRIGEGSALSTVGCIAITDRNYDASSSEFEPQECEIIDLSDTIVQTLLDNGFETDYKKARLHGHTNTKRQSATKTLTAIHGRAATISGSDRAVEQLSNALISMAGQLQKSFDVVCGALAVQHERAHIAEVSALDARVDAIDQDGRVRFMEYMIEHAEEEEDDSQIKSQAFAMLGKVAEHITGANLNTETPSTDQVKRWASENPQWLKDLISDPDIASALYRSYSEMDDVDSVENDTPAPDDNHPSV